MKVQEIMERSGIGETGRAIMYIKDALEEINLISETHTKTVKIDLEKNKRFYNVPTEAIKILDVKCKNHDNEDGFYKSIPRSIYEPELGDTDGI